MITQGVAEFIDLIVITPVILVLVLDLVQAILGRAMPFMIAIVITIAAIGDIGPAGIAPVDAI